MYFQSPYVAQFPYSSYGGFAPSVSRYGYDPSDYYPHYHSHQMRHFPSYQPAPVSHPRLVLRAVPAYESARAAHSARLIEDLEDLIRLGVLAQAEAQQHQQLLNENQQQQQQLESESASKSESEPSSSSSVVPSKSELPVGSCRVPIHRPGQVATQQAQVEPKQAAPRRDRQVSKSRGGRGGLFDVFSDLFSLSQMEPQDTFNTKMKEEDKQYVIEAQLPSGVTKDDVELNVENHLLTLTATVKSKPSTTQQKNEKQQEEHKQQQGQSQAETHERKKSVVVEDEKETENESVKPTQATQPKPKSESQSFVQTNEKHQVDSASSQKEEPIVSRSYTRMIQLPENASEDGIEAKFEDQILRIRIPKLQPKKTHKISIQ